MPKAKSKQVRVSLANIDKVCRECGKVSDTTRSHTFYSKNFVGPCGDSFCYASCDMDACHPVTKTICDKCLKKLSK